MAAALADALIAALGRRRASGERVAAGDVAGAAVERLRLWGVRRVVMAADPWLDALGVTDALAAAELPLRRWPPALGGEGEGRIDGWRDLLGLEGAPETCGVTVPVAGVARRGTLVLETGPGHGRAIDAASAYHLAVLDAERIHLELSDALRATYRPGRRAPSAVSLVSGPSRTSDIEKISTLGAHGALAVHVLVVERGGPAPLSAGAPP